MPAAAAAAISISSLVHSYERIPSAPYDMPRALADEPDAIIVAPTWVECQCDAAASPNVMRPVSSLCVVSADPPSQIPSSVLWVREPVRPYGELPPGIEEALLLSEDGVILEGLSSNFFAVLDGALRTAEERVLPGITRALVLDAAQPITPVVRRAVGRDELRRVQEAFITSASRGILPVVRIDGAPIGDGRVGGVTRAVTDAFAALVARERDDRF